MPGKRKNIIRHKDVFTSTFEVKESVARKHLRTAVGAKRVTYIEPAGGGTQGAPDTLIHRGESYGLLPCELKASYRLVHNPDAKEKPKYVQVRHVQPGQIDWHTNHFKLGGYSIILVLLNEGTSWETSHWAIVEGWKLKDWFEGMAIDRLLFGKDIAEVLGVEAVY